MGKKKCLTCKSKVIDDLESNMDNEIPEWYLKDGNYSLLPKVLTCEDKYNAIKNDLLEETPKITDTEVKVPIKISKNTWVFYWAADSNKNSTVIKNPQEAYNKNKNRGLLKSDDKGDIELILNTPQPYKVDGITYPRHLHYVTLKSNKTWDMNVKAIVVKSYVDKGRVKSILKSDDHIIIFALKGEKDMIPGSISIPHDSNEGEKNKKKFFLSQLKEEINSKEKLKGIDHLDVPLLLYCGSKKCSASDKLFHQLIDAGFSNITQYPGGLKEWNSDDNDFSEDETEDTEEELSDTEEEELNDSDEESDKNGKKSKKSKTSKKGKGDKEDKYKDSIDLTNLDKEKLVVKDEDEEYKIYNHNLKNGEVDEDGTKIGKLDGTKIIFDKEESDDEESDEEEPSDEEESSEESDDEESSEESSEGSDDENEKQTGGGMVNYEKLQNLKKILRGGGSNSGNGVTRDGISLVKSGGGITQDKYNSVFRGWGYTFF